MPTSRLYDKGRFTPRRDRGIGKDNLEKSKTEMANIRKAAEVVNEET